MPITLATTTTFQLGTGPTLNTVDGNGVVWRVNQDGFSGWGQPGTNLDLVQKPRSDGAWAGDAYATARTLTLAGTIMAPSPALLNAAIDNLKASVLAAGFTLTVTESGLARWVTGRRQGETIVQKITNLIASYSINVAVADPRLFGTALTGSTFLPSSSGGLQWPDQWAQTWTATTNTGQVSLTNAGNATGSVVLRIDGPCAGPQIVHVGLVGTSLTFSSSLILNAGEWLTVNMDARQTLANDQANRASYITSRGWSGFDPGINTWSFSAAAYNAAAKLTVTATPAWS